MAKIDAEYFATRALRLVTDEIVKGKREGYVPDTDNLVSLIEAEITKHAEEERRKALVEAADLMREFPPWKFKVSYYDSFEELVEALAAVEESAK